MAVLLLIHWLINSRPPSSTFFPIINPAPYVAPEISLGKKGSDETKLVISLHHTWLSLLCHFAPLLLSLNYLYPFLNMKSPSVLRSSCTPVKLPSREGDWIMGSHKITLWRRRPDHGLSQNYPIEETGSWALTKLPSREGDRIMGSHKITL
ncbi:hypothetical protein BsWGS_16809 [Bradybaena similaris]